jgi:hypothetical protein
MFNQSTLKLITLCSILLTGCVIPGARKERAALELQSNDSLFVVDQGEFHFRIILPKDLMIANEPAVTLSNDDSKLHITCGSDFHLIAQRKADKHNELPRKEGIFQYEILMGKPTTTVSSSALPLVTRVTCFNQTLKENTIYKMRFACNLRSLPFESRRPW